ncbi:hypothetical protein [Massilia sp. DWR3-1-1]|uniref:competence protein CoiA family protein n=1 Tax=Massilia sp. DWR3-1-1 TaxID=2804559 RepID=UPI003CF9D6A7
MPLRAVSETGNLHAFEYDASDWEHLKKSYRSMGLRMPCCPSSAIPKTSQLGTQFFAHSRAGICSTAAETPEHLYCKKLIAQAAQAGGWTVITEKPGASPTGEAWVADVFCEKGAAKVAFEVQMSPQTHDETVRRQRRYYASGIRSAWFYGKKLRRDAVFSNVDTPIFSLSEVELNKEPTIDKYGATLSEFVSAMLTKRLVWTPVDWSPPFYVGYFQGVCGKCKRPNKLTYGYSESLDDIAHRFFSGTVTAESIGIALARLRDTITNDELEYRGLNGVVTVHKNRGQVEYVNSYCQQCRMILSNENLAKRVNVARRSAPSCIVSADGELNGHPLELVIIDRNTDNSGCWTLIPQTSKS